MAPRERGVVVALNYYSPYVSGLTEYARMVAEGLAQRGWGVTVVTGQHERTLPRRESLNGVEVIRTPAVARVGKGLVSPAFAPTVARIARTARVLHLHLPMLEAGLITSLVRRVPVVSTYHCDVSLPGMFGKMQTAAVDVSARLAARRSGTIAVSSEDYAVHSRLVDSLRGRTVEVPAPGRIRFGGRPEFRDGPGLHVGFLGRIVEEKGIEYLVEGFRGLDDPAARLLIGGGFTHVAGGSVIERVRRLIARDPRIKLLGFVPEPSMADFYASIDVFALPSVNSLEAFGIVQVEALMLGIPVIASDLPGVRVPLARVGLGTVVPPRDAGAITQALRVGPPGDDARRTALRLARSLWGIETVLDQYANLLGAARGTEPPAIGGPGQAGHTRQADWHGVGARVHQPAAAPGATDLDVIHRTWDEHGREDPLWAILAKPGKRGGRWDIGEFFATGREEIDALIERLRHLGIAPAGRALDFGCGFGRLTEALGDHYERVDGVDVSQSMIAGATSHSTHREACLYHVNVRDDLTLFASETFDMVHSSIVLQHVGRTLASRYIREFARVLRPGGVLHFQLPTSPRWTPAGMIVRFTPEALVNRVRKMRMEGMREGAVRELLASLGLDVVDVWEDDAGGPRWQSRRYTARKPGGVTGDVRGEATSRRT